MTHYVLDTNIISGLIRRDGQLITKMSEVVTQTDIILGCPMIWYEIRRGLLAKDAKLQLQIFELLFKKFLWQDYNLDDWQLAASLWVKRRAQGRPIDDADLLIAVFAINRNAILVTNNEKDFEGLGLQVTNWI